MTFTHNRFGERVNRAPNCTCSGDQLELVGCDCAASRQTSISVMQDGEMFWFEDGSAISAPFPVSDYDMKAAADARTWFVAHMKKAHPEITCVRFDGGAQ